MNLKTLYLRILGILLTRMPARPARRRLRPVYVTEQLEARRVLAEITWDSVSLPFEASTRREGEPLTFHIGNYTAGQKMKFHVDYSYRNYNDIPHIGWLSFPGGRVRLDLPTYRHNVITHGGKENIIFEAPGGPITLSVSLAPNAKANWLDYVRVQVAQERLADLNPLTPKLNPNGSVDYGYQITGPSGSSIQYRDWVETELYYAVGPNLADIREKIAGHNLTDRPGQPISFTVGAEFFKANPPLAGRTHIVSVIDRQNKAAESNEGDNVKSIRLPNLVAIAPVINTDGSAQIGYRLEYPPFASSVVLNVQAWYSRSERWEDRIGTEPVYASPIDPTKAGTFNNFKVPKANLANPPEGAKFLLTRVDRNDNARESNELDNTAAVALSDLKISGMQVISDGSLQFVVERTGAALPSSHKASVKVFWSAGSQSSRLGAAILDFKLTGVTRQTVTVPFEKLRNPPAKARTLVAVADPDGLLAEAIESNNFALFSDPDDQLLEAINLGDSSRTRTASGKWDNPFDVDLYQIQVEAGRWLSFDIDTGSSGTVGEGSYLRLFDSAGRQLAANNDGAAPGEPGLNADSYLTYRFVGGGKYFVGVSQFQNTLYDVVSGSEDRPGQPWRNGGYTLTMADGDPDDTLAEAIQLGTVTTLPTRMDPRRERTDFLDRFDVDMFTFNAFVGQIVSIDLDLDVTRPYSTSWASLTLYDANGVLLTRNTRGLPPRESAGLNGRDAYIEFKVAVQGKFYVAVSSQQNTGFNPITGLGDVAGTADAYRLTITPHFVPVNVASGQSILGSGVADPLKPPTASDTPNVFMPNQQGHLQGIPVSLERVNGNGGLAPIVAGTKTWIVIHGREDDASSFVFLAKSLARSVTDGQVLLLDWSHGSGDSGLAGWDFIDNKIALNGAEWIPYVAAWTVNTLQRLNIAGQNVYIAGHSWGSYLAYEIAKQMGGVQGLVAMDPAYTATGYDSGAVNFAAVSARSWAFYGGGKFGSAALAGTADESFMMEYANSFDDYVYAFPKHTAPVRMFEKIVQSSYSPGLLPLSVTAIFDLTWLSKQRKSRRWEDDEFADSSGVELDRKVFEGVFQITTHYGPDPYSTKPRLEVSFREFYFIDPITGRTILDW